MVVGRRGADFYVSGLPFKHVGANIPQLVWMPAWQVQQELDYAAASGVKQVRVFLPNDAQTCYTFDGVYHDPCTTNDVIARLRYVVDEAYKRYLRVTVALAHNYYQDVWGWEKGNRYDTKENPVRHAWGADGRPNPWFEDVATGFYARRDDGLVMLNDSWIDWGYGAYYKPTVLRIVGAFQDHPGIFAWDIANEVNSTDPTQWWIPNFYKNMAAAIRQADPTHLITTGLISSSWAVANDTLRDAIYNDANIDYMTVHMYDGCGTTLNGNAQMDDLWRARNRYGKPIVIEENGFENGTTDGISKARSFYNDRFAGDVNWRANAILQWGWTANETAGNWGTGDTNCAPRVQGKQREYRALMGRWGGQLDTRLPLIVDSDANYNDGSRAQVSVPAGWAVSSYSGQRWGSNYYTNTTNNGATGESDAFSFKFYLPANACKYVDAWWNGNTSRTAAAPFVMYNASNQHAGTAVMNMQDPNLNDRWVQLGQYCFTAGWNRVVLSRWSGAPGYLIADAIRIR
ncbi:glycoside hydrolase family 2 TIM barrel-domain containing protein [Archangium violaceum]|nr:glycoside hydrolase family 2 TIM barrel-domain containing protein [Archangium violaceum]